MPVAFITKTYSGSDWSDTKDVVTGKIYLRADPLDNIYLPMGVAYDLNNISVGVSSAYVQYDQRNDFKINVLGWGLDDEPVIAGSPNPYVRIKPFLQLAGGYNWGDNNWVSVDFRAAVLTLSIIVQYT